MGWFDWLKVRPKGQKFEERLDIGGTPKDVSTQSVIPNDYVCIVGVEDFAGNVLARTYSKNGKLYLSMDKDTRGGDKIKQDLVQKFTWIHELCHVATWTDNSITHSKDPNSILYYSVSPIEKVPTVWDMQIMNTAMKKINQITLLIKKELHDYPDFLESLLKAIGYWNAYLNPKGEKNNFFIIKYALL